MEFYARNCVFEAFNFGIPDFELHVLSVSTKVLGCINFIAYKVNTLQLFQHNLILKLKNYVLSRVNP